MTAESALDAALRALRHRDRTTTELRSRLAELGFETDERDEAIETLLRTGIADDARYAETRARGLAERGAGDLRIRHELGRASLPAELVEQALDTLDAEADRARNLVFRRGAGPKTARYLRSKGFSDDVVAAVVAGALENELG